MIQIQISGAVYANEILSIQDGSHSFVNWGLFGFVSMAEHLPYYMTVKYHHG